MGAGRTSSFERRGLSADLLALGGGTDLDSMVSAMAWAYHLSHYGTEPKVRPGEASRGGRKERCQLTCEHALQKAIALLQTTMVS